VYAATVLRDGKLYVRTERVGTSTRASRIVQILEGAPLHDTRMANYARRFADRLVLPTLAAAGGIYVVTGNLTRAISLIVFDFATGIRVSAPTTVLASMTAAARRDVLIKGGRAIEQLAQMDTLVFDKTGTLTVGEPAVTETCALVPGLASDDVLALAAAAEQRLTHPAADAIVRAAIARGLDVPERGDSRYTIGLGVAAEVEAHQVLVGGRRFLHRHGVTIPETAQTAAGAAAQHGVSTVFVARDGETIGFICYADVPRAEARQVVQALHARGVRHVVMVTGDQAQVARAVAAQIGIDRVEAEVFPERKAEIVREFQAAGHVVGVIGDGINDSPALAYADVSISLKDGSDVARETADVVLHGDLHGLPDTIDTAREAMRLIRQNLAIVGVPNAAGMALATAGLVNPVLATAINNGSNVAAALNGLRPLLAKPAGGSRNPARVAAADVSAGVGNGRDRVEQAQEAEHV
jgi:Cu2+-exporting ATPase